MNTIDKNKILDISKYYYEDLMSLENVTGMGLGYKHVNSKNTGELALRVLVEKKVDKSILSNKNLIPKSYMNIQTDVLEIGNVSSLALTGKVRPIVNGYSIGPAGYPWAGTLGGKAYRYTTNNDIIFFGLSNNHVLANGNLVPLGTPISQPSSIDGGVSPTDHIGMLSQFVPIKFDGSPNTVDCAIAQIENPSYFSPSVAIIGGPTGVSTPKLNSIVQKVGRTSELTKGKVLIIGATISVNYGSGRVAIFTNQILSQPISQPGDSGSLVLDSNLKAVGLLFAGSSSISVFNDINLVLSSLKVSLLAPSPR